MSFGSMYLKAGHFDVSFRIRCMAPIVLAAPTLSLERLVEHQRRTSEERDPGLRGRCQVFCEASDREDTASSCGGARWRHQGQEEVRG